MRISVDFGSLGVLEKIPSKFGNGSHVFVPKVFLGRKAKIFIGDTKIINKKEIQINFFNSEILERQVTCFGTGAHIILPKETANKEIKIIIIEKGVQK
ncbi:MAG: DUF2080 family transposase-associated protein [Candidatus Pacearchaeota archaeon]|jgi:putative transposon-encoded protein